MTRVTTTMLVLGLALGCAGRQRAVLPLPRTPLVATAPDAIPPPPAPEAPPPFTLGEVHVRTLASGLVVILAPRPGVATSVVLANAAASPLDERAPRSVNRAMARLLLSATAAPEGIERSLLERQGFTPEVELGDEGLLVSARFPPEALERYLRALALAVIHPTFDPDDVTDHVADERERIRAQLRGMNGLVSARLRTARHDESDRRSVADTGSMEELAAVAPERLTERHREVLVAGETAIVIAGPIELEPALAIVTDAFADLRAGRSAPQVRPPSPPSSGMRRVLGVAGYVEQAHVRLRDGAPPRGHPDHAAFLVVARVLGGMFSARLNLELRERLSVSYGFHASYTARATEGVLDLATSVEPRAALHALRSVVSELRRAQGRDGGVRASELAVARTQARETLVAELETSLGLAHALATTHLAGLAPSALEDRVRAIDAIELHDVHAAARRWLSPDEAPVVLVAPHGLVYGPLMNAGIGAVDTMEAPLGRD